MKKAAVGLNTFYIQVNFKASRHRKKYSNETHHHMKPLQFAGVSQCMSTTVDSHQAKCVYAGDVYIKHANTCKLGVLALCQPQCMLVKLIFQ